MTAVFATRRFPNDLASVAAARKFVRDTLTGSSPDLLEAASLLTSELATNAILHGRSSAEVRIERRDRSVRIAVIDESHDMPAIIQAGAFATHGRGLALIRDLSEDWGVIEEASGKAVWFCLSE
jgi:anti-sigma regulatory factor (Ser/Thr protein kinase)